MRLTLGLLLTLSLGLGASGSAQAAQAAKEDRPSARAMRHFGRLAAGLRGLSVSAEGRLARRTGLRGGLHSADTDRDMAEIAAHLRTVERRDGKDHGNAPLMNDRLVITSRANLRHLVAGKYLATIEGGTSLRGIQGRKVVAEIHRLAEAIRGRVAIRTVKATHPLRPPE